MSSLWIQAMRLWSNNKPKTLKGTWGGGFHHPMLSSIYVTPKNLLKLDLNCKRTQNNHMETIEESSPWKWRWIKELRYPCNQCDYKAHLKTTCEESWYTSNQCEYKTTDKANLKNHIETTCEESWYPCKQCEYKTTPKVNQRIT